MGTISRGKRYRNRGKGQAGAFGSKILFPVRHNDEMIVISVERPNRLRRKIKADRMMEVMKKRKEAWDKTKEEQLRKQKSFGGRINGGFQEVKKFFAGRKQG